MRVYLVHVDFNGSDQSSWKIRLWDHVCARVGSLEELEMLGGNIVTRQTPICAITYLHRFRMDIMQMSSLEEVVTVS